MTRTLTCLLLLCGCQTVATAPVPSPEPVPVAVQVPMAPPPAVVVPTKIRAALARAAPKEQELVASPQSDPADIALMTTLHRNVVDALAELERDGGRHVTPAAVTRARTAVRDLENHLAEFKASQ